MFSIIRKIFNKDIKRLEAIAACDAVAKYKEEEAENKQNFRKIEAKMMIGKPIIALSNEWNEPIVGELVDFEQNEHGSMWFVYKNYITNQESFTLASCFAFSEQKLKLLGKLNPDEYCCLFYEGRNHFGEFRKHPNYGKIRDREFTNYENWIKNLHENGFYDKFGEFLKEEEANAAEHLKNLENRYGSFNY